MMIVPFQVWVSQLWVQDKCCEFDVIAQSPGAWKADGWAVLQTFQAKFLGSISKGVNLSLCICAHLFMSLCSSNLKPCWFSQLVFLHSDGRKKDDILFYHFHQNTFGQAPPRCLCWLARRYFHLGFNLVLLYLNLVEVCVERIPLGHVYRTHGQ